jgi:hypothetical protein
MTTMTDDDDRDVVSHDLLKKHILFTVVFLTLTGDI